MICIVESTIESIQNKNPKIQTYITYNLYNHYMVNLGSTSQEITVLLKV